MSKQSAINQPLAIILHLDGRIRALGVEYDELGTIDVYVLEGEALRRHLMREAISMQSACTHLLAAGEPRVRQMVQYKRLSLVEEPEHGHDGAIPTIERRARAVLGGHIG